MTPEQIKKALDDARTALAQQYVGLDADDWDVANSRSSADAGINLVELYLSKVIGNLEGD